MDIYREMFRLFQEQVELVKEIGSLRAQQVHHDMFAELAMHKRDQHQSFWDEKPYLEIKRKLDSELIEKYELLEKNKKQISQLLLP